MSLWSGVSLFVVLLSSILCSASASSKRMRVDRSPLIECASGSLELSEADSKRYLEDFVFRSRVDSCLPGLTNIQVNFPRISPTNLQKFATTALAASTTSLELGFSARSKTNDISILSTFSNLRSLRFFSSSSTEDFSVLTTLPHLKVLQLEGGTVLSDLSFLSEMKSGLEELYLYRISDISDMTHIRHHKETLKIFHLRDAREVTEFKPISDLVHLESLVVPTPGWQEMEGLGKLKKLKKLHMSEMNMWNYESLCEEIGNLSELEDLDLAYVPIYWMPDVFSMRKLRRLNLGGTFIEGIGDFPNLADSLEVLDLHKTRITDVFGLEGLKKLRILDLGSTNVNDISGLETCENLESVNLEFSEVKDLTPLTKLRKLTEFNLVEFDSTEELREHLNELQKELREDEDSDVPNH